MFARSCVRVERGVPDCFLGDFLGDFVGEFGRRSFGISMRLKLFFLVFSLLDLEGVPTSETREGDAIPLML